ncbi:hypothetical protein VIGAN_UM005600, partial [Vigna angularis var. angularis]
LDQGGCWTEVNSAVLNGRTNHPSFKLLDRLSLCAPLQRCWQQDRERGLPQSVLDRGGFLPAGHTPFSHRHTTLMLVGK